MDNSGNTGGNVAAVTKGGIEIAVPNSSMTFSTLVETPTDKLERSRFAPSLTNKETIPNKGIKLSFMESFINKCGGKSEMEYCTTAEVYERFVMPTTARTKTSYCDCGNADLADSVGNAQVYISHSWEYVFLDVVDTLQYHFRDTLKSLYGSTYSPTIIMVLLILNLIIGVPHNLIIQY